MDITVVGDVANDLISYSQSLPRTGQTVLGGHFQSTVGGNGANQAVAAANLGAKVSLIATVGADPFGGTCVDCLKGAGVQTDAIRVSEKKHTGVGLVMVNSRTGENQVVAVNGANTELSTKDVDAAVSSGLFSAKLLTCLYQSNAAVGLYALEKASQAGTATQLDFASHPHPDAPFRNLLHRFLAAATIASPNEYEAAALTGVDLPKFSVAEDSSRIISCTTECLVRLLRSGVRYPVVTLGANGIVALLESPQKMKTFPHDVHYECQSGIPDGKAVFHLKCPIFKDVVDTTGAGDCFAGSLAFFMAKCHGLPLVEKLRRAVWVASRSVMRPGAQSSYPHSSELPASLFDEKSDFLWPY